MDEVRVYVQEDGEWIVDYVDEGHLEDAAKAIQREMRKVVQMPADTSEDVEEDDDQDSEFDYDGDDDWDDSELED